MVYVRWRDAFVFLSIMRAGDKHFGSHSRIAHALYQLQPLQKVVSHFLAVAHQRNNYIH
jgi:hypothetical protein